LSAAAISILLAAPEDTYLLIDNHHSLPSIAATYHCLLIQTKCL
jgi:hypothetical protein